MMLTHCTLGTCDLTRKRGKRFLTKIQGSIKEKVEDQSPLRAEEPQAFRDIIAMLLDVTQHLEADDLDSNMIDSLYFQLDWLHGLIIRYFDVHKLGEEVLHLIGTARNQIADNLNRPKYLESPVPPRIFLRDLGWPKYLISRDQVEFLLERCFSVVDIASLLMLACAH